MNIEVCKWYNNADSPVLFMIDDLANVWIDTNGNGKIDLGEDWGYAKDGEYSSFNFLNDEILNDYPDVKVTFFTPVGIRVGIIENPSIKSVSKMINCDEETKTFFKYINDNPKYEIAYHGTSHGRVGKTNNDFKQEWELFNTLEEAIETIEKGKEIYKDVFGYYPRGGKYCGYKSNEFSDESIDKTDFLWWSRYWNRGIYENKSCSIGGSDFNKLTNYDVKNFGNSNVIDIPSTLNGGLLTGILNYNSKTIRGILKKILIKMKLKQVDYLLRNRLVISIQEHIAPSRDDGGRQTPNIFDDKSSLKCIFNYFKGRNLWYCTGTELAEYVYLRDNVKLIKTCDNRFSINIGIKKNISKDKLTFKIDRYEDFVLNMPNGKVLQMNNNIINIPILPGEYRITQKIK